MFETLVNIDWALFKLINSLHTGFLDPVMVLFTNKFFWIPLYAALAIFLYWKYKKQGIVMVLFAAVLITISDQSSVFIKDNVKRERPCHNDALAFDIHLVNNKCGGLYGFVSSHAANTVALAFYLYLLTFGKFRWLNKTLFMYVILIGYSRVYLGNHYPADILGGWIVGFFTAILTYFLYRSVMMRWFNDEANE